MPRPYVTAALLCERVIQEKDESLTIVRVADKIQYQLQGVGGAVLPEGIKPVVPIQGVISIKSGPVTGEHAIKVFAVKPNGQRKEIFAHQVTFQGGDHGQNIIMNIGLGVEEDGLYWFDVVFDEEILTRIPLMIMPVQEQALQEKTAT